MLVVSPAEVDACAEGDQDFALEGDSKASDMASVFNGVLGGSTGCDD